ncbi:hypothetical protein O181_048885 [Austropuccinia psidii MF-1]|uniref:Peptidase A2 domain-containing protein n=1 Tax=Austropuccinia psidii MF-1 TaxID=1389203 RepID=A0A9Q3HPK4_9BASI|nr:hypothetical protein [Austropuccinia psidii MF-1]
MHYGCPLGMIEVSVGLEFHELKELVDNGAELSIIPEAELIKAGIPMRALNMSQKAVHTVIGRPFLAYTGIRLEHAQTQGEILSFRELDGRTLSIPICSRESNGWHTQPPKRIEMCNMAKAKFLEVPEKNEESRFEEITEEDMQEIEEEQGNYGLYGENTLEVEEKKKKENKFEDILNMEECTRMNKWIE